MGKTAIILFVFKILKKLGIVDCLFVLAKRLIVYEVWPPEVKKWKGLEDLKVSIVHGPEKKQRLAKNADIYLMNYDGLPWLRKQKWFFRQGKKLMLAVDESSKLRNTDTERFRSLKAILPKFRRRYIATGSPTPRSLMNIFGQIYVLDLGASLGSGITKFRNKYFNPSGYGGFDWKLQDGAEKKIFKKLRKLVIRYGHDQLDLPPLTFIKRYITLGSKARELYDELEAEYVADWQNDEIVAANAAVASGKLRQIANGGIYINREGDYLTGEEGSKETVQIHYRKCEALVELLEELEGEPALVAYEYGHDKERLQRYLKKCAPQFKDAPFVDGKSKPDYIRKVKRQWDKGELPVIFGNPATVAHGLNMQGKGGIVIYFALTWDLENYEQFYQRVWRQGQKRRVLVYLILARDTVDEIMVHSLKYKDKGQQRLLRAMEHHYRVR